MGGGHRRGEARDGAAGATTACSQPSGTVPDATGCDETGCDDTGCDDTGGSANAGDTEVCSGEVDDDRDGLADDADGSLTGATTGYRDSDGDGDGTAEALVSDLDGGTDGKSRLVEWDRAHLAEVASFRPSATAETSGASLTSFSSHQTSTSTADSIVDSIVDSWGGGGGPIKMERVGDMDGDGVEDVVFGCRVGSTVATCSGAVYLMTGPISGTVWATDCEAGPGAGARNRGSPVCGAAHAP